MERFFVPSLPKTETVRIAGAEAHHMLRVKRVRRGDLVVLFDGSGAECKARLEGASKNEAALRIVQKEDVSRELPCLITLACAPAKGERMDVAIRKCAELGLSRFIPTITDLTIASPGPHRIERWRRICIEASKQSGRNLITDIRDPMRLNQVLSIRAEFDIALMPDTSAEALPIREALSSRRDARSAICLIGPEAGFTQNERAQAHSADFRPVRLVPSTLTIEAAAIASVAMLAYALQ